MRGKFQMMFIQYGELPNQQSYHKEGPWKLYRWNLPHPGKKIICAKGTPKSFFSSTTTDFIISAKSQPISCKFAKFQKFRNIRETGKLLEPQANSRKFFVVNHKWPKLSFLTKRQWFGDAWKVTNDVDSIWWIANSTKSPQRRPLKAI